MEQSVAVISFIFLILTFGFPFLCLKFLKSDKQTKKQLVNIIIVISGSIVITILFAWWNYKSTILLLDHFNAFVYNPDSDGYQLEYQKVLSQNLEKVKSLETSYYGIGWTLKAIFGLVFIIPYSILIYLFGTYTLYNRRAKNETD